MPKPWEVQVKENLGTKPWEMTPSQIAQSKGLALHTKTERPLIEQTMPPEVSKLDRFQIANFSNDPKAAVSWLQDKYPDFEIGLVGDQIGMKKKGVPGPYQALIPNASISDVWKQPENLLQKVSDNAYNIASGLATGAASGLAAGLAAPSGPGAIAAGVAAGGAANAALETGRQGIGLAQGINKELKPGEIALSGATGAATPLLFGTSASPGLAGKVYDTFAGKVAPKAGEIISGVPSQTIKTAADKIGDIKDLEKNGVLDFAEKAHEDISGNIQRAKTQIGQNIQQKIENAGGTVDITDARKPFQDLLTKLNNQYSDLKTPEMKSKIKDVEDQLKYYFSKEPGVDAAGNTLPAENISSISPTAAFSLKQSMANLGDLDKVREYGVKSSLSGMSPAQKEIAIAARGAKSALDKGIEQSVNSTADALGDTSPAFSDLKSQYRDLNNIQDYIEPYFKTPDKTFNTMRNSQAKSKEILFERMGDIDQKYGTNSLDNARTLDAYNYFANPSFNPLSTKGSTSTGRAIPLAAAGGTVGYFAGHKMGMGYPGMVMGATTGAALGSPAALRGYMAAGRGVRNVQGVLAPNPGGIPQIGANMWQSQNQNLQNPWTLFPEDQNNQGVTP